VSAQTVSRGFGLSHDDLSARINIITTVLVARFKIILRYKGAILFEMLMPVAFAAMPILLGISVAGSTEAAGENFAANGGALDFKFYMLLGSSTFIVTTIMLWLVGYWIRREQEMGTIESIYLSPAKRVHVVTGVTVYALARALIAFVLAFFVGSAVFGIDPFQGNILLALLFVSIGLLPLWGIAFAFGALILKIKEANSLIQIMMWAVAFLMGIYYPVAMLPPFLQFVSMAFPPTWMTNGVRASLLDVSYFFGEWYFDFAVLFAFALVAPLIGYAIFLGTERRLRKGQGVGQY
jgi:ABC-2 type transport system permease protein